MSVAALIKNPQDLDAEDFYIPIASELVFEKKWKPIIEELNFQWLPLFSTGVNIEKIDLNNVLNELSDFRALYIKKFGIDDLVSRVDLLSDSLVKVFKRGDVIVFIG